MTLRITPAVITAGPPSQREPEDFCRLVAGAGIRALELGTGKRGAAEARELEEYLNRWERAADANGLHLAALNCSLQPDQRADIRVIFAAAAARGVRLVKVDVSPYDTRASYARLLEQARENWRQLVPLAREFGVRALAEVHPKIVCHSPSAMRRMLDGLDPEAVGAILDPGNMVYEGWEDIHESVEILGPYLAHLHVKNGAWQRNSQLIPPWEYVATRLDDGMVDWFEVCRELERVGYEGYGVLEFLRDYMDNPRWVAHDTQMLMAATRACGGQAA